MLLVLVFAAGQEEIAEKIIPLLSGHPEKVKLFGIGLVSEGYYDAAFRAFQKLDSMSDKPSDVTLLFMALSGRAGSGAPGKEKDY